MNKNLNLTEILKDFPMGTKLYSPIFGEVEFQNVVDDIKFPIRVKVKTESTGVEYIETFASSGKWSDSFNGECLLFPSREQRDWSKFKPKKHKFDTKTLKPFDKVLVRDSDLMTWECECFLYIIQDKENYPYACTYHLYKYCIPYNDDTRHLVGTAEEAPVYYRYWEY